MVSLIAALIAGGCSSAPATETTTAPSAVEDSAAAVVPPPQERPDSPSGAMTMSVTLSDQAQLTTIAFDALAYLTGDLCTESFFPPGKVSDFFGFQYLRDNEPDGFGHNTAFAASVGENILYLLDDEQIAELADLATEQVSEIDAYGYARFPLMVAFRRLLNDDLPAGSDGLSTDAVATYSADVYRLDGEISYARAALFADILANLSPSQAEQLAELAATDVADWPDHGQDSSIADWRDELDPAAHVALMTLAGQLYSWYAGDVTADTYFCPERHGTYFGSFYMKDIPAMVSQQAGTDVTINENLTGQYGDLLLATLDEQQRATIDDLLTEQEPIMEELVAIREAIATQLRLLRDDPEAPRADVEAAVLELSARYGEFDGQLVARYATAFDQVYETLTDDQLATLWAYREDAAYLGLTEDPCSLSEGDLAYLYSETIEMPAVADTSQFFMLGG